MVCVPCLHLIDKFLVIFKEPAAKRKKTEDSEKDDDKKEEKKDKDKKGKVRKVIFLLEFVQWQWRLLALSEILWSVIRYSEPHVNDVSF